MTADGAARRLSRLSIVGLGVIGGSLARALRARLPRLRLVGVERAEVVAAGAWPALVDECLVETDEAAVQAAFAGSDIIVLAAPINGIQRWLAPALASGRVVTDCGSTKRELVAAASRLSRASRFVPGHPMAGAGAARAAAEADLFEGRSWILCPDGVDADALAGVESLIRTVGARSVHMTAAQHDRAVALTSHAPRLLSSVLTGLVERERAFAAAGPAFERLLRGAGGDTEMWGEVLRSNADEVARALRALLAELGRCTDGLERGELAPSLDVLAAAERARQRQR